MKAALRLLLAPYRFSVDRLFRMGQVGGAHWFDSPSLYPGGNHLYLYQDSAGTTPDTAVGQTIGLSLDRAYGGALGPELLGTGVIGLIGSATAATYNTSTGEGTVSRVDGSNQSYVAFSGLSTTSVYRFTIYNPSGGSLFLRPTGLGPAVLTILAGQTLTGHVTGFANYYMTSSGGTKAFTVNLVRLFPGNHLIQSTSTARPTLASDGANTIDGTDDFYVSTSGGGGTLGFFYCAAIAVSSGAGTNRTVISDTGTNTGYRVRINSSNKLEFAAGNGSAYTTVESNETITAPGTYVLSAWDNGGVLAVQVNNNAAATTTRPTVSAGTSTLTLYRDNGASSSYLNGKDYGSIYLQRYPGESMHNRIKVFLAARASVIL